MSNFELIVFLYGFDVFPSNLLATCDAVNLPYDVVAADEVLLDVQPFLDVANVAYEKCFAWLALVVVSEDLTLVTQSLFARATTAFAFIFVC